MDVYDFSNFPYREGVIGIVQNNRGKFLIVQMVDYSEQQWRFAGGGVDAGETPREALLRELKEELGSNKSEVVKESQYIHQYDWPDEVIRKQLLERNRRFRGQVQRQFLVRFTGRDFEIKPDPKELRQVRWVKYEQLKDHFIFANQWELAEKVLNELLS